MVIFRITNGRIYKYDCKYKIIAFYSIENMCNFRIHVNPEINDERKQG